MGNRLTRIYTRTGDEGTTGLADGKRRAKNDPRVHCMGEVDELNASIGFVMSQLDDGPLRQVLFGVQHDLFDIGAELCQPGKQLISEDYVNGLERSADEFGADLGSLKEFILPGGNIAASTAHIARAVCRRTERRVVSLAHQEPVNAPVLGYLNRLSDLLFVIARVLARADGGEVLWRRDR